MCVDMLTLVFVLFCAALLALTLMRQRRRPDAVADKAIGSEVDLGLLSEDAEQALARKLFEFPGLVGCARDRAPFRIT